MAGLSRQMACVACAMIVGGWALAQDEKPKPKPSAPKTIKEKVEVKKEKPAEPAKPNEEPKEKDPFAVPEKATIEELFTFIDDVQQNRPLLRTRDEAFQHYRKVFSAIETASGRILKMKPDEAQTVKAFDLASQALQVLRQIGDEKAQERLNTLVETMLKDERPAVAARAKLRSLESKIGELPGAGEDVQKQTVEAVVAFLRDAGVDRENFSLGMNLAQSLEFSSNYPLAAEAYREVGKLAAGSEDVRVAGYGMKLQGAAKRLDSFGKVIAIKGTTVAGEEFNLESLKGKVVLIDFWATWCGPCIAELPNVKKQYDKYHEKGFEVVGISLDNEKAALEEFIKDQELKWVNLFPTDEKQYGWENPLANEYGILGIPATILVDKEGKVAAFGLRGEALAKKLEELLDGPAAAETK